MSTLCFCFFYPIPTGNTVFFFFNLRSSTVFFFNCTQTCLNFIRPNMLCLCDLIPVRADIIRAVLYSNCSPIFIRKHS